MPRPIVAIVGNTQSPLATQSDVVLDNYRFGVRKRLGVDYEALRRAYRDAGGTGAWMVNNGYTLELANQALAEGADLVAFGRPFIANPDLVDRLRVGGPFNTVERATLYGGGEHGYTDYPTL